MADPIAVSAVVGQIVEITARFANKDGQPVTVSDFQVKSDNSSVADDGMVQQNGTPDAGGVPTYVATCAVRGAGTANLTASGGGLTQVVALTAAAVADTTPTAMDVSVRILDGSGNPV